MRWRPVAYTAVGLASVLVLGVSGYAWTQVSKLTDGLATADVIEPAAQLPSTPDVPVPEQNILLVGIDSRTDAQGDPLSQNVLDQLHAGDGSDGGDTTDTMIVVHIPAGGGEATAISIPRDSYVQIAGGYGKHKINAAYSYGKQAARTELAKQGVTGAARERQADQAGARTAIQTVESFTGLTINHYAAVNLLGFYTLSMAVGGVPVCLKEPVHDSYSGASFPAGQQTLSGAQALAFVRQRHGLADGDLDRIARQQAFLSSAAKVVLAAGTLANPVKLGNLIAAVQQSVLIDSGWDILTFAQQMRGLSSDGLTFATIPVQSLSLQTPGDGDAVKVDPVQVRSFIQELLGKTTTSSSPGVDAQAAESSAPPTTVTSLVPSANTTELSGCVD
ncbi:LCP family protein [Amycolatopsis acidiphila]|uniref:LytR family transcriptional regulator n=1 Tax=Amycolatopsis acidiphila TaxID=715473 RepID=A0A557ZTJ2_9PSEU|nr:LCP family protein [Amycolatopsis acidiphila]TVT15346.1 LytR family transcriptional regulator [Amycolatopsis acidiphila]UIJ62219.1 LCP family protein [Amycolatopsis acidiphila]GHG92692.1 LytTR family transcriptional regulator [Amycolatopsis acidiphila]